LWRGAREVEHRLSAKGDREAEEEEAA
jgi:hypothetical protein